MGWRAELVHKYQDFETGCKHPLANIFCSEPIKHFDVSNREASHLDFE